MKKRGSQTFYLDSRPNIASTGCAVGPMEADGPIGGYFDEHAKDQYFDEETWEKAESKFILTAYKHMMKKVKLRDEDIDVLIAGDLLNQSISSVFGLRGIERPFVGIYGACSTIAEGMCLGSMMVDGGFTDRVACLASSHFCSAERQFRAPLELGNQRCPSTQWTATAAGCVLIENPEIEDVNEKFSGSFPYVEAITLGKMVDFGVTDSTNMGATMAPAAADTIVTHMQDLGRTPDDYDLIVTGDLGEIGSSLCLEMTRKNGKNIQDKHQDCGLLIFNKEKQDVHAGGSGCGCAASVFSGYFMKLLEQREIKRMLFLATGALFSPTSQMQGESIPGIAHALSICID